MHTQIHICTNTDRKAWGSLELNVNTAWVLGWRGRWKRCGLSWVKSTEVSSIPITVTDAPGDVYWHLGMKRGIWGGM